MFGEDETFSLYRDDLLFFEDSDNIAWVENEVWKRTLVKLKGSEHFVERLTNAVSIRDDTGLPHACRNGDFGDVFTIR